MPRRVLFMISSMRGGGSERQTLLMLQHLDRKRFEPHLYVTQRAGDLLTELPDDVTVHSFEDAERGGFYLPGRVRRQQVAHVAKVIAQERIQAIYDRTFHMTMIAGAASASLGVPRVSTIVSPPHRAVPLVESRFVWLKKRRLAAAYKQSRSIVAVSAQAAESARHYYDLESDSVKVLLNPVDIEAVLAAATQSKPQRDDRTTLVCVGRMTSEKGHADLIDALALTESRWSPDQAGLKVWFVGDGPLRGELLSQCTEKLTRHEVEFCGTESNPLPRIAAADALVLPSHFEGMPNVVLESMAIGTPVIATKAGGTVELEREEPTICWANPQDAASLSDALMRFVGAKDEAQKRAHSATRLVQTHHDIRLTIREIEDLLAQD